LVLSPGPVEEIRQIKKNVGWIDGIFIEDEDLRLADKLGIRAPIVGMLPSLLVISPDLHIETIEIGRG